MRQKFSKILLIALSAGLIVVILYIFFSIKDQRLNTQFTTVATLSPIKSSVLSLGSIVSPSEQTLHFLAAGTVVTLPFKEGDEVKKGQVIAAEDPTTAAKNVSIAEANYRSAQSALNLVLDNIHLYQYGSGGFSNVGSANETQTQKTDRQEAEEAVNAAYENLQISKDALSKTVLTAPFDGTLIKEDIKSTGVNVLATDSFVLADLNDIVFEAKVPVSDNKFISLGKSVEILLDQPGSIPLEGLVSKIYPGQITLDDGSAGFKVDVSSTQFNSQTPLGQTGSLLLPQNLAGFLSIPTWTILSHQYVWIMKGNSPFLQKVEVGESYAGNTQILQGLESSDKVIIDPKKVIDENYLVF